MSEMDSATASSLASAFERVSTSLVDRFSINANHTWLTHFGTRMAIQSRILRYQTRALATINLFPLVEHVVDGANRGHDRAAVRCREAAVHQVLGSSLKVEQYFGSKNLVCYT